MEVTIHKKPKDLSLRSKEEQKCLNALSNLNISYDIVDHDPLSTIEDCEIAQKALDAHICKNLFLCNRQKTKFHLLLMPGDKRFVTKNFSKSLGVSRCSFASAEDLKKYLNLTPGSVTVFGLLNDTEKNVNLVIDKDLLDNTYIGCHPMINTSTLKIKVQDLLDVFLPETNHEPNFIELSEEQ